MAKTKSSRERNLLQEMIKPRIGAWGYWLNISALPRNEVTTNGPIKREELQRSELIASFLLVMFLFMIFDFILAFRNPIPSLFIVAFFVLVLIGVTWLNRNGHVNAAGTIMMIGMVMAVMGVIYFVIGKRNNPADLFASYDFFIYPIIIGSLFLPRNRIFPITSIAIAFIILHVIYGEHQPLVLETLHQSGILITIVRPVAIIAIVALVIWLAMGNIKRSLLQVDRAEELIAAQRVVEEQSQQLGEQNERLAVGIAQLLSVHQEAARGNYAVRVMVNSDDLIWQVGRSLNNLLVRYEKLASESQEMHQTRQEVETISAYIEALAQSKHLGLPQITTASGKRLLFALQRLGQLPPPTTRPKQSERPNWDVPR